MRRVESRDSALPLWVAYEAEALARSTLRPTVELLRSDEAERLVEAPRRPALDVVLAEGIDDDFWRLRELAKGVRHQFTSMTLASSGSTSGKPIDRRPLRRAQNHPCKYDSVVAPDTPGTSPSDGSLERPVEGRHRPKERLDFTDDLQP